MISKSNFLPILKKRVPMRPHGKVITRGCQLSSWTPDFKCEEASGPKNQDSISGLTQLKGFPGIGQARSPKHFTSLHTQPR
jgi:hypothetical protein